MSAADCVRVAQDKDPHVEEKILELLSDGKERAAKDIAQFVGCGKSRKAANPYLYELQKQRKVIKTSGSGQTWRIATASDWCSSTGVAIDSPRNSPARRRSSAISTASEDEAKYKGVNRVTSCHKDLDGDSPQASPKPFRGHKSRGNEQYDSKRLGSSPRQSQEDLRRWQASPCHSRSATPTCARTSIDTCVDGIRQLEMTDGPTPFAENSRLWNQAIGSDNIEDNHYVERAVASEDASLKIHEKNVFKTHMNIKSTLLENLWPGPTLCAQLHEQNFLTPENMDTIQSTPEPTQKCEKLIRILEEKEHFCKEDLRDAVAMSGQVYLAMFIENPENTDGERPMTKAHRTRLQENNVRLLNNIELNPELVAHLVQEEILTEDMVQHLDKFNGKDKVASLLSVLLRSGDKAYGRFKSILVKTGHCHLQDILR